MNQSNGTRRWWYVGGISLLVIAALAIYFAIQAGAQSAEEVQTGDTTTVFVGDLASSATASGRVSPRREAQLSLQSAGIVDAVLVRVGDEVQAGDVLVQLDTADLVLNVANAEQLVRIRQANLDQLLADASDSEFAAAQADVASAQANLDNLLAGPRPEEIAAAEADVRASAAGVASSVAQLNDAQNNTITQADLEAAKAELVAAEYQLEQAQDVNESFAIDRTDEALQNAQDAYNVAKAKYDNLLSGVDPNVIGASSADVAAATARRDGSQADLDELLLGATEAEIAAARLELARAEDALADLLSSADDEDIRIAQAELTQAEISLADAQEQLAKAMVVAPFDGVITAVSVTEGEFASGAAVEIVDNQSLEVILNVDEVDVASITVGQEAILTLETWPNEDIPSQVNAIAPSATSDGSGLVSYEVHLGLENSDLPIRVGMTANATLITERKEDVLLVSNRAITADREAGKYYVNLQQAEGFETVEVQIGLRDGRNTQILGGVNEGDVLVISNIIPNAFQNGQGGPGSGPPGS